MRRYASFFVVMLCISLIGIRGLSGSIFIDGAIERTEIYSHTCFNIDPNCHQVNADTIQLEDDTSHELNLMLHLLGTIQNLWFHVTPLLVAIPLIAWMQVWRIEALYSPPDHPPKH